MRVTTCDRILSLLADGKHRTPAEINDILNVDLTTLNRNLKKLERLGRTETKVPGGGCHARKVGLAVPA